MYVEVRTAMYGLADGRGFLLGEHNFLGYVLCIAVSAWALLLCQVVAFIVLGCGLLRCTACYVT